MHAPSLMDPCHVGLSQAISQLQKKKCKSQRKKSQIQRNQHIHPIKPSTMKVLSLNFLTCAVKACKSSSDSYPLHPKDAELVQDEIEVNPQMLINVLPRLDWAALKTTSSEVCRFFPVEIVRVSETDWDFWIVGFPGFACSASYSGRARGG